VRFNFWRGIILGSLLGALFSMFIGKPGKKERSPLIDKISRQIPGASTRRFLKGVTKTVSGIIK
jgi:hypothetical protein